MATPLFTRNIIACVWDFDKTLIAGYMQAPLFRHYGVDEAQFWAETNRLVEHYAKRGYRISGEIGYLNSPAERLTGYSKQEAVGLILGQVFHLLDEEGSQKLIPVSRVLIAAYAPVARWSLRPSTAWVTRTLPGGSSCSAATSCPRTVPL